MDLDFNYLTNEELDELIVQIKEAKEARAENRKTDLWNNVRRAVQNYVAECGTIEFFDAGWNYTVDADSFSIPGEINLVD